MHKTRRNKQKRSANKTRKAKDFSYKNKASSRMIKSELHKIIKYSDKLYHCIHDNDKLPGWVQKKIFNSSKNLSDIYHYLDYKMMEK